MCPNGPIYTSDRSTPPPTHQIAPHTPRSVALLPQLGQVCANNPFVPSMPVPSPPSSSSGTTSSRGSSPYSPPVEHFVGDDYPYPYVSFVEPQQYVFHPLKPSRSKSNLLPTRFKPLFTSSGIETSTPPNEGSHYVFPHVQQQFYELYRPYKAESSEPPLNQTPSHPYPPAFAPDYANTNQRTDFTCQAPCEQYPHYSPARSSVDYTMFADQNPDYIMGTSNMRYTASSPPNQSCVSPAMVSDGSPRYVEVSEPSPSPPVYDVPSQDSVCDPRAVSGFEGSEQRSILNFPMKRSPSATPPTLLGFADRQPLEAGDATPHVQQESEVHSSGESEVEREEYEDEKDTQTSALPEQPELTVKQTIEYRVPSSAQGPTSMPTAVPADIPLQPACEATSMTITVPPPVKRRRGQAGPVPVPNLTKKSRGRNVPTVSNAISPYGTHRTRRSFICVVSDCGKCFARGEHLKRHIRSIHTNDKRELNPVNPPNLMVNADVTL